VGLIYLDNNASTELDPEAREAFVRSLEDFGNPSSVHSVGRRARQVVEEAREDVARLVGADPEEIVFTSGGTEANALAIFSAATGGGRIVRSSVEHPSVAEPFRRLGLTAGVEPVSVPPEAEGAIDPGRFLESVRPGTRFVSIMAASNEYGAVFPVGAIAEECRARGALVHTDAVQAAGRIALDVARLAVDYLSVSAHKLHGPKGVGALYVRRGAPAEPVAPGGGQEKRRRSGTENTPAIAGFGAAARLARQRLEADAFAIASLRDRLEGGVLASVAGARVIGARAPRLPNTSAVLFPGLSGQGLLVRLDLEGIAVSVGSACSSGTVAPSPALVALGLPAEDALRVVRFSLSRRNTGAEIDRTVAAIATAVADMRPAEVVPA
jgi:cysteine desulfurase